MRKIFYGGPIITMDDTNPRTEAVLVEDGSIVALGALDEMIAQAGDAADRVDLQGNAMMPGLVEPHAHFDVASCIHNCHFIGGLRYDTAEEVLAEIKRDVDATPVGKWVFCFGLDYLINRDLPEIDRYWLDEITSDRPLFIMVQSMHTGFLNSKGLEVMNITRDTPDPRDGHIYKDENGEPTGVLTEQTLLFPIILAWMQDLGRAPETLAAEQFKRFKKVGITTTWTAGMMALFPNQINLMAEWGQSAPVRQDYAIAFNSFEKGVMKLEDIPEGNAHCRFTGIKFWYDGSPYTGNMLMEDNYLENDTMQKSLQVPVSQAGERLFEQGMFYELLKKYHQMGYQISVHSQGNRANRELVDMFERLLSECPREDHRHRIEHCAFMHSEDIERCAKLGITLSYHIGHLYYYGEALNDLVIGKELVDDEFMCCRTALDAGMKVSLHSDDPMYFANPLLLAATAASRTSKRGLNMQPEQALSIHEALRAITIDAAWQQMRESELGSIEVGKFADFTVLKKDPYTVDPYDIKDIEVVTTYLAGIDTDTM